MPDPRLDRIAAIGEYLADVDPPAVRDARLLFTRAQADLAQQRRLGSPERIVDAYVYRAERALERLRDCLRALPVHPIG